MKNSVTFEFTGNTDGSGYWTRKVSRVRIVAIKLNYINKECTFGELVAYFDTATWNTKTDGLVYTDDLFLAEFKSALKKEGYDSTKVHYSEQGMQGKDYISFDVTESFIDSFRAKHPIEFNNTFSLQEY